MGCTRSTRGALAVVALLVLAATGRAQETEPDTVRIEVDAQTGLASFLDAMSESTGRTLLYDPQGPRIANQTVGCAFAHEVPAERVFDTYRAILSFYELTVVPVGPAGHEVHLVLDARSTNSLLRNKAMFVEYERLADHADKDGLYVTCVVPVERVVNLTLLRTALATMTSPAGIGRVLEGPNGSALVVTDFAPVVAAIAELVTRMEEGAQADAPVLESIELEHADAVALAEALTRLLAVPEAPRGRGPSVLPDPRRAARVLAWAPRNALLISASAADLTRLRGLVAVLDRPTTDERVVEVVRLRRAAASYVAAVLERTLQARGEEGAVVADPRTNAVLVTGAKQTVEALRDLIAALEELSRTL